MADERDRRGGKSLDFESPELELAQESQAEAHDELIQYALASDKESLNALGGELLGLQQKLEEKDEAFKSQILHTETITMMAKYQLVYIKMENFWKRLERVIKKRSIGFKCDVMYLLRKQTVGKPQRTAGLAERLHQALKNVSGSLQKQRTKQMSAGFAAISLMAHVTSGSLGALQEEIRQHRSKLADRERTIKALKRELGGGSNGQLTGLLKKKSSKDKLKIKRKDTTEDLRIIKENQKFIQEKNDGLEAKIKATESQIFKFISDMSTQISLLNLESSHSHPMSNEPSRVKVKKQLKVPSYL